MVDARVGHDVRVDEDDVSHGDEGGQPGDQLRFDGGAMQRQLEQALQPATLGGRRKIQSRGVRFRAVHGDFLRLLLFLSALVEANDARNAAS